MKYVAAFDIGTSALKGVIVDEHGNLCKTKSCKITTISKDNHLEQFPEEWYNAFKSVSQEFFVSGFDPQDIEGIIFSGHMQNVILLDDKLNPISNALLYSDTRGSNQAKKINSILGEKHIKEVTANTCDGATPLAKLLWIKENNYSLYQKVSCFLGSPKDFIIARLTNKTVCDVTAASTTGLFNIHTKKWEESFFKALDLDIHIMPKVYYAHECVGKTLTQEDMWYAKGTPVYCGAGDAGSATYAGGIRKSGEFNINIGTTGWLAAYSPNVSKKDYVFNLCAVTPDLYINVTPFLNAGSVHKWISGILFPNEQCPYAEVDKLLLKSEVGSDGLMFLPYLVGERFPVLDEKIKGGYYGITLNTSRENMARAALESVAFSIKQGLEQIDIVPEKITLIGGGGRVSLWCQIIAEILGFELHVYENSEYLPAKMLAQLVFKKEFQQVNELSVYTPDKTNIELYKSLYTKYKTLYPAFCLLK